MAFWVARVLALILSHLHGLMFLQSLNLLSLECGFLLLSSLMPLYVWLWYKVDSVNWFHFWKILEGQASAQHSWVVCLIIGVWYWALSFVLCPHKIRNLLCWRDWGIRSPLATNLWWVVPAKTLHWGSGSGTYSLVCTSSLSMCQILTSIFWFYSPSFCWFFFFFYLFV